MPDITIEKAAVNLSLLNETLKAALPAIVDGITHYDGKLIVHIKEGAKPDDLATISNLVAAHDAGALSSEQEKAAALETKAATNPVNEEKLLAGIADAGLRAIIVNLWARLAVLEGQRGINRDSVKG